MTKSGLSRAWQGRILAVLNRTRDPLDTRSIGRAIGYQWYPKCSAVRVTLHWMTQCGLVHRIGRGIYRRREEL